MASAKQYKVTSEGMKSLTDELTYLKDVKRKEVVEAIRVALSFGDLSENSEYDEAKNEQAKVETRISELEEMLKHVKVITDSEVNTEVVNVGAKVTVYVEEDDEEVEYSLVGSTEADPMENKISDQSPIGQALLGAKNGSTVVANTPAGELHIQVKQISK